MVRPCKLTAPSPPSPPPQQLEPVYDHYAPDADGYSPAEWSDEDDMYHDPPVDIFRDDDDEEYHAAADVIDLTEDTDDEDAGDVSYEPISSDEEEEYDFIAANVIDLT